MTCLTKSVTFLPTLIINAVYQDWFCAEWVDMWMAQFQHLRVFVLSHSISAALRASKHLRSKVGGSGGLRTCFSGGRGQGPGIGYRKHLGNAHSLNVTGGCIYAH